MLSCKAKDLLMNIQETIPVIEKSMAISLQKGEYRNQSPQGRPTLPTSFGGFQCPICHWKDANNSEEGLLKHYQSKKHKKMLKDRFASEKLKKNDKQGQLLQQNSLNPNRKDLGMKTGDEKKLPKLEVKKKTGMEINESGSQDESKCTQKKDSLESFKIGVEIFSKAVAFIQPISDTETKCTLCSKVLPKAKDSAGLTKNVLIHVGSKRHLSKLSKTQKTVESKEINEKTNQKCSQCISTTGKLDNANVPHQNKEQIGSTCERTEKRKKNKKKAVVTFPNQPEGPQVSSHKVSRNKKEDCLTTFLCLHCQWQCSTWNSFQHHTESETHLQLLKENNIQSDLFLDNKTKCNICKVFVFGSLYAINEHYDHCSQEKRSLLL